MGKVIRFPLRRRMADVGRGARIFEALLEQEHAALVTRRASAQALSIAALLATTLQVLSIST